MYLTAWSFRRGKTEQPVLKTSRRVVTTAVAAIDTAVAAVGITRVLSYLIADAVASRIIKTIVEPLEAEPSPVSLVYSGKGALKIRKFVDFSTERQLEKRK